MARGITQAQVNQAADALLQRGERPTIEKVRANLGTGSPNTLMRMLEVWWAGLAERLAAQARANLPGIPEVVQRAMMTVWSEAVVSSRRDAESNLAERERQLADSKAEASRQVEQARLVSETKQRELAQALDDLGQIEEALAHERHRSTELQEFLSGAIRSQRELQATIEALRRSAEDTQRQYRSDLDRASAAEKRWLQEVDRAREEAKTALRDAKSTHAELSKERQQRLKLGEQLVADKREFKQTITALERKLRSQVPKAKPRRLVRERKVRKRKSGG